MYGHIEQSGTQDKDGVILGLNEERYSFAWADWRGDEPPRAGDHVEFSMQGDRATAVCRMLAAGEARRRSGSFSDPLDGLSDFDWKWFLFDLDGRVPRSWFWKRWMLLQFVLVALIFTAFTIYTIRTGVLTGKNEVEIADYIQRFAFYLSLVFLWPNMAVQIKRLRDRNRPPLMVWGQLSLGIVHMGLMALHVAAPLADLIAVLQMGLGLWIFIECGFLPGTAGPNRYGPDPLSSRQRER